MDHQDITLKDPFLQYIVMRRIEMIVHHSILIVTMLVIILLSLMIDVCLLNPHYNLLLKVIQVMVLVVAVMFFVEEALALQLDLETDLLVLSLLDFLLVRTQLLLLHYHPLVLLLIVSVQVV